ncbi:MAG: SPFH domain-containing protein [Ruminococcaceae bacterium]|nr:SPFH domain-containing protein [Oscillospiraceae bacterium]
MGLIKAIKSAVGTTLADQWKEFFYCDSIPNDVLVVRGRKKISSGSSNTKGDSNIISNGSGIAVADGQCMIIVDQGKVVEFCAEPGEYTFNSSSEPSIFSGEFGDAIMETLKNIGKRFTYGGDSAKDQRVYYFNTKEIIDNKFGTPNPVPFRVVDSRIGLDIDVSVRANGVYTYRITNPVMFYTNVCGNVVDEYAKEEIEKQLKVEFISALAPALAKLSALEMRPSEIPAHHTELEDAMNEVLSKEWSETRGISIVSVAVGSVTLPDDDAELIKNAQKNAMLRDPSYAAATLVGAQADAMKMAASNSNGAAMGFMGMNMAQQAGGLNAQALYAMGNEQRAAEPKPEKVSADEWTCSCGAKNSGKFCSECGSAKPADGWTCSCGTVNKGKFCSECRAKKPAGEKVYRCDKCGWEPEDKNIVPKFCPECGDRFDEDDVK